MAKIIRDCENKFIILSEGDFVVYMTEGVDEMLQKIGKVVQFLGRDDTDDRVLFIKTPGAGSNKYSIKSTDIIGVYNNFDDARDSKCSPEPSFDTKKEAEEYHKEMNMTNEILPSDSTLNDTDSNVLNSNQAEPVVKDDHFIFAVDIDRKKRKKSRNKLNESANKLIQESIINAERNTINKNDITVKSLPLKKDQPTPVQEVEFEDPIFTNKEEALLKSLMQQASEYDNCFPVNTILMGELSQKQCLALEFDKVLNEYRKQTDNYERRLKRRELIIILLKFELCG